MLCLRSILAVAVAVGTVVAGPIAAPDREKIPEDARIAGVASLEPSSVHPPFPIFTYTHHIEADVPFVARDAAQMARDDEEETASASAMELEIATRTITGVIAATPTEPTLTPEISQAFHNAWEWIVHRRDELESSSTARDMPAPTSMATEESGMTHPLGYIDSDGFGYHSKQAEGKMEQHPTTLITKRAAPSTSNTAEPTETAPGGLSLIGGTWVVCVAMPVEERPEGCEAILNPNKTEQRAVAWLTEHATPAPTNLTAPKHGFPGFDCEGCDQIDQIDPPACCYEKEPFDAITKVEERGDSSKAATKAVPESLMRKLKKFAKNFLFASHHDKRDDASSANMSGLYPGHRYDRCVRNLISRNHDATEAETICSSITWMSADTEALEKRGGEQ